MESEILFLLISFVSQSKSKTMNRVIASEGLGSVAARATGPNWQRWYATRRACAKLTSDDYNNQIVPPPRIPEMVL